MMLIPWAREAQSLARRHTAREGGAGTKKGASSTAVSPVPWVAWRGQDGAEPFLGSKPTAHPDLAQDLRGEPWMHTHSHLRSLCRLS